MMKNQKSLKLIKKTMSLRNCDFLLTLLYYPPQQTHNTDHVIRRGRKDYTGGLSAIKDGEREEKSEKNPRIGIS